MQRTDEGAIAIVTQIRQTFLHLLRSLVRKCKREYSKMSWYRSKEVANTLR